MGSNISSINHSNNKGRHLIEKILQILKETPDALSSVFNLKETLPAPKNRILPLHISKLKNQPRQKVSPKRIEMPESQFAGPKALKQLGIYADKTLSVPVQNNRFDKDDLYLVENSPYLGFILETCKNERQFKECCSEINKLLRNNRGLRYLKLTFMNFVDIRRSLRNLLYKLNDKLEVEISFPKELEEYSMVGEIDTHKLTINSLPRKSKVCNFSKIGASFNTISIRTRLFSFTQEDFRILRFYKGLDSLSLNINYMTKISELQDYKDILQLDKLKLKSLRISIENASSDSLFSETLFESIKSLRYLEELDLEMLNLIGEKGSCVEIASLLTRLREMEVLSKLRLAFDYSFGKIHEVEIGDMKNIKEFKLEGKCAHASHIKFLSILLHSLPSLKSLFIKTPFLVTEQFKYDYRNFIKGVLGLRIDDLCLDFDVKNVSQFNFKDIIAKCVKNSRIEKVNVLGSLNGEALKIKKIRARPFALVEKAKNLIISIIDFFIKYANLTR